ncbi:MAG: helix-turn-helix domain-containing protein, partial [Alphaproteobacteria bacterium]
MTAPDLQEAARRDSSIGTRDRLLRAGARLFAEQGFHAVSVRAIVAEADVNLGAINYHFGSKQALFEEIFAEGAQRMVRLRLELLGNCREAPDRPPLLEQAVTAYLAPGLVYTGSNPDIVQFQRFPARITTEH